MQAPRSPFQAQNRLWAWKYTSIASFPPTPTCLLSLLLHVCRPQRSWEDRAWAKRRSCSRLPATGHWRRTSTSGFCRNGSAALGATAIPAVEGRHRPLPHAEWRARNEGCPAAAGRAARDLARMGLDRIPEASGGETRRRNGDIASAQAPPFGAIGTGRRFDTTLLRKCKRQCCRADRAGATDGQEAANQEDQQKDRMNISSVGHGSVAALRPASSTALVVSAGLPQ